MEDNCLEKIEKNNKIIHTHNMMVMPYEIQFYILPCGTVGIGNGKDCITGCLWTIPNVKSFLLQNKNKNKFQQHSFL